MKTNTTFCYLVINMNTYFVNVAPHKIWESNVVKILGVSVEASLKFNIHGKSILNKAGRKLTILARMSNISKNEIINKIFFESQFAYCPLVCMFI